MQDNPNYEDVTVDIIKDFSRKIENAQSQGINDIIIDPGFGFGKTLNHNYEILNNLELFKILNRPILVGISRKSMIYKVLNNTPQCALTGTISLKHHCINNGSKFVKSS
jgi:dihydropteroate synthase